MQALVDGQAWQIIKQGSTKERYPATYRNGIIWQAELFDSSNRYALLQKTNKNLYTIKIFSIGKKVTESPIKVELIEKIA